MDSNVYQSHLKRQHDHWWFNARQKIIEVFFKPFEHEIQGGKILDIGSGGGRILHYLSGFGPISAIDPEESVVSHIRREFGPDVGHVGSLPNQISFPEESLELVTTFDVLEHVPDDKQALQVIHKLLQPNGIYLMTVPAMPSLWSYHDDQSHHVRRYTQAELTSKLESAGFRVERITYFNTLLLPLIVAFRFLIKLLKGKNGPVNGKTDMDYGNGAAGWILERIFLFECFLIRRGTLPLGLSLITVCRKV